MDAIRGETLHFRPAGRKQIHRDHADPRQHALPLCPCDGETSCSSQLEQTTSRIGNDPILLYHASGILAFGSGRKECCCYAQCDDWFAHRGFRGSDDQVLQSVIGNGTLFHQAVVVAGNGVFYDR
jgi:hypothetical protein